jgi:hypothetical protein
MPRLLSYGKSGIRPRIMRSWSQSAATARNGIETAPSAMIVVAAPTAAPECPAGASGGEKDAVRHASHVNGVRSTGDGVLSSTQPVRSRCQLIHRAHTAKFDVKFSRGEKKPQLWSFGQKYRGFSASKPPSRFDEAMKGVSEEVLSKRKKDGTCLRCGKAGH